MDEGMGALEYAGKIGYPCVRVAGSGMLLGTSWEAAVDESVEFINRLKDGGVAVEAIADHEHCGAAEVKADQIGREGEADELYEEFAKEVADFAGIKHISAPLSRPETHHDATAVYFTNTPFHPLAAFMERDKDKTPLENGFVISRFALDERPALNDLKMAIGIALGEHGLGNFSVDNPLKVVVVGSRDELKTLGGEVNSVAEEFGDVVRVSTLTVV
jgi:hypothetical protein